MLQNGQGDKGAVPVHTLSLCHCDVLLNACLSFSRYRYTRCYQNSEVCRQCTYGTLYIIQTMKNTFTQKKSQIFTNIHTGIYIVISILFCIGTLGILTIFNLPAELRIFFGILFAITSITTHIVAKGYTTDNSSSKTGSFFALTGIEIMILTTVIVFSLWDIFAQKFYKTEKTSYEPLLSISLITIVSFYSIALAAIFSYFIDPYSF